jgi:hypothetical protein
LQIKKEIIKRLKANDSENIHKRRGETKRSSENIAPIARDEYQKKAQQNH